MLLSMKLHNGLLNFILNWYCESQNKSQSVTLIINFQLHGFGWLRTNFQKINRSFSQIHLLVEWSKFKSYIKTKKERGITFFVMKCFGYEKYYSIS